MHGKIKPTSQEKIELIDKLQEIMDNQRKANKNELKDIYKKFAQLSKIDDDQEVKQLK